MSEQGPKIITTFRERLEIDRAIRSLGETSNELELHEKAAEIAERFGDKAIPALVGLLNTNNAQLRGGLGHLAARLDRDQVVSALTAAALDQHNSDQARLAAITILQRFLGVEPTDAMYAGMANPEELAVQSLREVLAEAQTSPLVFLEYLEQLAQEPPDVLLTMVRSTARLEAPSAAEMLRLFAQDPFPPAAREAVQMLGDVRDPAAAEALQSLLPTLPPALRSRAERSLLKLRMWGVPVAQPPPPPAGARCLASPVDAAGHQFLVFVLEAADGQAGDVLQMVISDERGIIQANGGYAVDREQLPDRQEVGTLHKPGLPSPPLLEAPFDYGRRRVRAALACHWDNERPTPLAYRLLNPLLWRWTEPQDTAELPQPQPGDRAKLAQLLRNPALSLWYLESPHLHRQAEKLLLGDAALTRAQFEEMTQAALRHELERNPQLIEPLKRRLAVLREWLILSGDEEAGHLAATAAATLDDHPETHPLLLHMAGMGLRMAMINLARGAQGR